jgi:hypothetical protein
MTDMDNELRFPKTDSDNSDSLGEPLVSLMREAYTPPDAAGFGDVYWSGLESRVMARIAADTAERGWWAVLAPWARVGLAAAAAIFMLAGVVNQQLAEPADQVAYEVISDVGFTSATDEPIAGQYVSRDASGLSYYLSN